MFRVVTDRITQHVMLKYLQLFLNILFGLIMFENHHLGMKD